MKVTYGKTPKKIEEPAYPYFGEFNNGKCVFVVMFTKKCTGIIVKSNDVDRPIHYYSSDFSEISFKKLDNFSVTFSVP